MTEIIETLSYLATVLGIPAALLLFVRDRRRERTARYRQSYADVDVAYVDFMKLCLENSDLSVLREEGKMRAALGEGLSDSELRRKWALYAILISVLERAFVNFYDCPEELRDHQWDGWEVYALDYLKIPEFRRVWNAIGSNFDERFFEHIEESLSRVEHGTRSQAAATPRL